MTCCYWDKRVHRPQSTKKKKKKAIRKKVGSHSRQAFGTLIWAHEWKHTRTERHQERKKPLAKPRASHLCVLSAVFVASEIVNLSMQNSVLIRIQLRNTEIKILSLQCEWLQRLENMAGMCSHGLSSAFQLGTYRVPGRGRPARARQGKKPSTLAAIHNRGQF